MWSCFTLNMMYTTHQSRHIPSFASSDYQYKASNYYRLYPRAINSHGLNDCVHSHDIRIGRGATGIVHPGTLKQEISDRSASVPLDVVVKLAFGSEQRDALRTEYEVY